ncbi:hypothetical protein J437_LFUL016916 [Ladona fulva]|uniref:Transposase domain-containing protein n=1 Tax=Ladona fulva TaxID=123851 RepID=A0A8K0PCI1_LADFU|nr:hypothetical protein J437_LFUL016916 [Ladona fulva]
MHLVCLGVTKRLLSQWTSGPNSVRLGRRSRNEVSDRLYSMAMAIPSDFSRIPRWKATEFRTFLLYTGPVALKNILSKDLYDHFLILHVAIRILCSEEMAFPFCSYASELLKSFVQGMTDRYGMDSLVYNIYSLIHLADDVKFFKPLLTNSVVFRMKTSWFGIEIENIVHDVVIHAIVCDAPARSFIKCTKGHTGYSGCERCVVKGEQRNHRMVFCDVDAELRNDTSFRNNLDKDHHTGETPLLSIECLDMVSQFPLDYMHLVCLGVTKRLLSQWTSGPNSVRLGRRSRTEVSDRLYSMATAIPSDFSRIPRGLDILERWKATEFRTFLLYTGPVAMKNILSKDLYDHFLILHVAIRILCSEEMAFPFCGYASELLKSFVQGMTERYGMDSLVYNVHSLIHLADDVKFFQAPLDKFSSFPYENFLGKMKKMVRSASNPLGQISRRLAELDFYPGSTEERKEVLFKCSQFGVAEVTVKGTRFSAVNTKDSFYIQKVKDERIVFEGSFFERQEDYYTYPCKSSNVNVFKVWKLSRAVKKISLCDELVKCLVLMEKGHYVVFALIN